MQNSLSDSENPSLISYSNKNKTVVIAGATGQLGQRITKHLKELGVNVVALVREASDPATIDLLQNLGVTILAVDFDNQAELTKACRGASCLVSAMSGLEEVIVDAQTKLLNAALDAGVSRFIPSDFSIDYTRLAYGSNRNLDLRRQFNEQLDKAPIAATSILNGMFTDLLTGQAPMVLFGLKRVVYWGDENQLLDFTTLENTAEYTARAAADESTPRYLRIAGDVINSKGMAKAAGDVTGLKFKLLRAGGLSRLQTIITIARTLFPQKKEVFPAWQGMQYMHNMFTGLPKFDQLDNNRYPEMQWTSVQEMLAERRI